MDPILEEQAFAFFETLPYEIQQDIRQGIKDLAVSKESFYEEDGESKVQYEFVVIDV